MPRLSVLNLNSARITDEGQAILARLPQVESIYLYGTSITAAAVEDHDELRKLDAARLAKEVIGTSGG